MRELARQALSSTERGYDLLAPKFDFTPFRTPPEVVEKALHGIGPVDDAMDLCCGTGAGLEALTPITRRRLIGVDFSAGMLEQARARVKHPGLELWQRDVLGLELEQALDLVTCFGAFGHILPRDEARFVAMVRRALRPGGRFVFVTARRAPWSRRALLGRAFNAAMHVRNAVLKPEFVMFYLTFELPEVERTLRFAGLSVELLEARFDPPYDQLVGVIATRR